jgi:hypothetical protein
MVFITYISAGQCTFWRRCLFSFVCSWTQRISAWWFHGGEEEHWLRTLLCMRSKDAASQRWQVHCWALQRCSHLHQYMLKRRCICICPCLVLVLGDTDHCLGTGEATIFVPTEFACYLYACISRPLCVFPNTIYLRWWNSMLVDLGLINTRAKFLFFWNRTHILNPRNACTCNHNPYVPLRRNWARSTNLKIDEVTKNALLDGHVA